MKLAVLGASGKTGRHIVEQALAKGHQVRALVRDAAKLGLTHPELELLTGDATDAAAVRRLVEGCDAVVSALGPTDRTDVCSAATANVIAARPKRYVAVSGAGLDVPGDRKGFVARAVSFMVKTVSPAVFADKVKEHALLAASDVRWTLVRPPRLTDQPAAGNRRTSLDESPGAHIARADLAAFVLQVVADDATIGKAPFVSA
ncbi:MAG: NAD(P)H-binding protein [Myxococcaceae bacterium]|nr:NAD(P)H-binding protein [Myxococcaceae bacterium]